MADALLSDADVGLSPASASAAPPPAAAAPTPAPSQTSVSPPASADAAPAPDPAPSSLTIRRSQPPALMSDADVGLAPSSSAQASAQGQGPLGNTQDDSWTSGGLKGAATGVIKGLAHIPGWVGDADDLATFLASGAASLFDSRSASDIYKSMKAKSAALPALLQSPGTLAPNAADIAAPVLAKTGEYKPTSEIGSLAQAGVEAAAGGLGPGAGGAAKGIAAKAILTATAKQAPLNAIAGIAGQGATDATGNPYLGLATSLIAPGIAEAGGHAAHAAVGSSLEDIPVVGKAFAGTRDANVGKTVSGMFADPAKRDAFMATDPSVPPIVAGAEPTLGQQTGDFGVLRAEEKARTADNIPFLEREQDQNSARRSSLASMAPADADTMAPSQFLAQKAAAIDAADTAAHGRILQHAQDLASQLGPGNGADVNGQVIGDALNKVRAGQSEADQARVAQAQSAAVLLGTGNASDVNGQNILAALETSKAHAQALRRHLYDPSTIDPDGSLNLVTKPMANGAQALKESIDPLGAPVGGDAARIMGKMQGLPDVLPYKSVMALDSDITASMAKERRANGETPDWRLLSQMKGHVMDAINGAVDNRHAYEQSQVAAGAMRPDETGLSRMRDVWDHSDANGRFAGNESRAVGNSDAGGAGSGAPQSADATGTGGSASGAPRQGDRDPRVSGQTGGQSALPLTIRPDAPFRDPNAMDRAPQRPPMPRPQNLHDFIRRAGGMEDPGGDLKAMGLQKLIAKPGEGLHPDKMREAAAEAGYLGGDTEHAMHSTDINDLLNAAENGDRVYSVRDHDAVSAYDQHDQARTAWQRQQADSEGRSSTAGIRPKAPLSSYGVDDIYPPGMAPEPPAAANDRLIPSADQPALDRINAAKAFHADYAQTFQKGPVAQALKTNGFSGQYTTPAGTVPGKVVPKGPAGYEITKQFLKAANYESSPAYQKGSGAEAPATPSGKALAEMKDHLVAPLRAGLQDGMLPQKIIDKWKSDYGPALRAIDEASPGFSTQFDKAGSAYSGVVAGRESLKSSDPTAAFNKATGAIPKNAVQVGDTGYGTLKSLFTATKNDPAVVSAVQDHILQPLRAKGLAPDATLSPAALAKWKSDYGPALKAIDEVSPGFSGKFDTAAKATDILARAGATRQANIDAVQKGVSAKLMGKTDPGEVESTILGMLSDPKNGPTQIRDLKQSFRGNPDALAGAQKAAVDAIVKKFVNTAESGTSGEKSISSAALQKFVASNQASLRALLPDHSVNTLQAVAASLEQANRDITGTRIKGTSQTAKNQHGDIGKLANVGAHSAIGVALVEGMMQAYEHGGIHGAVLAGAGLGSAYALNKFRANGLSKEQGMVRDALLNPERARMYLSKVSAHDPAIPYRMLSNSLRRSLITTPIVKASYQAQR